MVRGIPIRWLMGGGGRPSRHAPLSPPLGCATLQVLLGQKQWQEARELLQAALDVCGKRCAGRVPAARCACSATPCFARFGPPAALQPDHPTRLPCHVFQPCLLPPTMCRWADRWKKDAVRLLLFEALLGLRDFGAAMQSLRPVTLRWPFAPLVWNAFGR